MAPHPQRLSVSRRSWPLAQPFAISRGSRTTAEVVIAELFDGDSRGRGECVPYARYGESVDSVAAALEQMKGAVFSGLDRAQLQTAMPPIR
jgi:L-alanine-DL-glutamate epimerase-like enolase superfamily enzyme